MESDRDNQILLMIISHRGTERTEVFFWFLATDPHGQGFCAAAWGPRVRGLAEAIELPGCFSLFFKEISAVIGVICGQGLLSRVVSAIARQSALRE